MNEATCPKRGFGYAWNGANCGHCYYPLSHPPRKTWVLSESPPWLTGSWGLFVPLVVASLGLTLGSFGPVLVERLSGSERTRGASPFVGLFMVIGAIILQLNVTCSDWSFRSITPIQRKTLVAVLVLYGLSCVIPAIHVDEGGDPTGDPLDFRIGSPIGLAFLFLGTFMGWSAWAANLLLLPAISCLARGPFYLAALLGTIASLAALTTRLLGMKLLLGYHLWQLSFAVLAVGAMLAARHRASPAEQASDGTTQGIDERSPEPI